MYALKKHSAPGVYSALTRRTTRFFVLLNLLALAGTAFGQSTNPRLLFFFPATGTALMQGANVVIWANASDPNGPGSADDGTIAKVEFFRNNVLLGQATAAPFRLTWSNAQPGTYTLKIKAYDAQNNTSETTSQLIVHPGTLTSNRQLIVDADAATGGDGSPGNPYKTIQQAAEVVLPGDQVLVKNGTYVGSSGDVVTIRRTGKASHWITFKNYPGHSPLLQFSGWQGFKIDPGPAYIRIEGFRVQGNNRNVNTTQALAQPGACEGPDPNGTPEARFNGNGISVDGRYGGQTHPHHIEIRNNTVFECGGLGIGAIEADYVTIEKNNCFNNSWYTVYGTSGISLFHPWNFDNGGGYRNKIRGNKCYGNILFVQWNAQCRITDGNGIILDDFKNTQSSSTIQGQVYTGRTLVSNNVVFHNGGSGIHSFKSVKVDIVNNTAYFNSRSAETTGEIYAQNSDDVKIFNNVIYVGKYGGVDQQANFDETGLPANRKNVNVQYDYNLYFNTTKIAVSGPNDLTNADPLFERPSTDLALADFRLKKASPAVNSGSSASGRYDAVDFLGISRPQGSGVDRGAYEFQFDTRTLEAEDATLGGGAVVSTGSTGYTGTGLVDYVNASGDYVEWQTNLSLPGTYILRFRYALQTGSSTSRDLNLKVNGSDKGTLAFPGTGSWSTWQISSYTVSGLAAGTLRVRLTAIGQSGPNMDNLVVERVGNLRLAAEATPAEDPAREIAGAEGFVVQPNPVQNGAIVLSLSDSTPPEVRLNTTDGRSLPVTVHALGEGRVRVHPAQRLPAGVYVISVTTENYRGSQRVVIP